MKNLDNIVAAIAVDPGLIASIPQSQIDEGLSAAQVMNEQITRLIAELDLNSDGLITAQDLRILSKAIRANPQEYQIFLGGHGNDENGVATGFHNVQNDGGNLVFDGRNFIDTVADAIYHYGFRS